MNEPTVFMKKIISIDHMFGHVRIEFKVLYVHTINTSPWTGKRSRFFDTHFRIRTGDWNPKKDR